MTGLEKIIDKILSDAKDKARVILEKAQEDCRATAEAYAAEAEKAKEEIALRTEKEGTAEIERAKSAAAMNRRNILSAARSALLDEVFEEAKRQMIASDFNQYRELLTALVNCAVLEQEKNAKESKALGDEVPEFERFEVIMNAADAEKYGNDAVNAAKRALRGKVNAELLEKITLAEEHAEIDGGVIVRYGNIEANCSLAMLFAEARRDMEPQIAGILFSKEARR